MIGGSNRFAHAAAQSVAEMPARRWNPLFVYGDAGFGQDPPAPGHRQLRERQLPGLPGALRHLRDLPERVHRLHALRHPRRLQAPLPGHRRAAGRRRAVLPGQAGDPRGVLPHLQPPAPDQPPNRAVLRPGPDQIGFEDRLRSRFQQGLLTDIQPPELETRLAILRKKAELETARIPPEVLEFIAANIKDNIRVLEAR